MIVIRPRSVQMFFALTALIILGIYSLPPSSGTKDFIEDYVSARALLDGQDPFAPLNQLIQRYVPEALARFPHPNAHPPLLMLVSVPAALLPYDVAVPFWFILSIVLLFLVGRWLNLSGWASLAFAAWPPLWAALGLGGSEMILLATIVAAWVSAREKHDWRAGALLGLAAGLKLFPILLFLPYLVRRRFQIVVSGAVVFGLGQVISLALVGPAALRNYYLHALPAFNEFFVGDVVNQSPHGALLRVFGGATDLSPIFPAPAIVLPLTIVFSLIGLIALGRLRPEAGTLALLVVLPAVWTNYVALAMPQLVYLWRQPNRRLPTLLAAVAASWILPFALARPLFTGTLTELGLATDGFLDFLGAIQPVGLVGLLALSWRAERDSQSACRDRQPGYAPPQATLTTGSAQTDNPTLAVPSQT